MGTTFRPYDPDQPLLLPQDLREWVPAGHLAEWERNPKKGRPYKHAFGEPEA